MLEAITGTYNNGVIIFDELPTLNKAKVVVTIMEELIEDIKEERLFGTIKGKIKMAPDFDTPLDELKEYM